jgi:nitroreductase
MTCGQYTYPIDLAIAMDHMSLQAVEEGLGTCWIGAFKEEEVKKILGISPEVRVVELMSLGYPLFIPEPRSRKKFEDIITYDRWS